MIELAVVVLAVKHGPQRLDAHTLTRERAHSSSFHSLPPHLPSPPSFVLLNMAQLDPSHSNQGLRISQLLPSVKCSSCGQPVSLDQLGDHTCSPALASSNPASDTNPSPPPLSAKTAPSLPVPTPSGTSMDPRFRRRPSTNQQQDGRVYDGAHLRNGSNLPSSLPPSGAAPSTAPSRNGLRSPAQTMSPSSPSRLAQNPLVSPSSPTRQRIPRPEMAPVIPRLGLSTLEARSSPFHRRPSAPSSPLAQPQPPHGGRDPRSAPMAPHPPVGHPVRSTPSPAPSEYPPQRFAPSEIDTKSGGAAGMAGVGRRGFAAVAHAAMFAIHHPSHLHSPTAPSPATWVSASSPPQGMSSFIH